MIEIHLVVFAIIKSKKSQIQMRWTGGTGPGNRRYGHLQEVRIDETPAISELGM